VLDACVLAANVVKDLLAHRDVLVQGFNELDVRFEQKVLLVLSSIDVCVNLARVVTTCWSSDLV